MNKKIAAIGGLGGSGSRLVAKILAQAGVFMGDDISSTEDNRIFTRLFRKSEMVKQKNKDEIFARLQIFKKYLYAEPLSLGQKIKLCKAALQNEKKFTRRRFYLHIALGIKPSHTAEYIGWKEPNTQFYLKEIYNFFPEMKYIHIVRNGADMAFSENLQQLKNWGFLFGLEYGQNLSKTEIARRQFEFWYRTNVFVSKYFDYKEKFYLLNFDKLCVQPEKEIERLLIFLGLDYNSEKISQLSKIPRMPESKGRYKMHDCSFITQKHIRFLNKLEFYFD